jgi:FkbM family methyltransferase
MASRMPLVQETVLPDMRRVFCLNKDEVPIVYQQVQEYLKHGLEINQGDTVLDVGANIGLFALWLQQQQADLTIYAFEPIAEICNVLRLNAERFKLNLKAFPFGLADQDKTVVFKYYPNATPLSTAYPDTSTRNELKQVISRTIKKEIGWLPVWVQQWITNYNLKKVFEFQEVICELRTLSEVIAEEDIQQIDLLKVDVERSEMDVLLGIQADDWLKIRQVVVEVHNVDDRVKSIKTLLGHHSFEVIVDQEEMFKGSNIFNIYASKNIQKTQT